MNIFLSSNDPNLAAQHLCDLRLNKMILETAQMLCTAFRALHPEEAAKHEDILYKPTHANHPCSVWMHASRTNYIWSLVYFEALYTEKLYRTQKSHLSYDKLWKILSSPYSARERDDFVMPDFAFDCSNQPDTGLVFHNYQRCLHNKWIEDTKAGRTVKWTKRARPRFSQILLDKAA